MAMSAFCLHELDKTRKRDNQKYKILLDVEIYHTYFEYTCKYINICGFVVVALSVLLQHQVRIPSQARVQG